MWRITEDVSSKRPDRFWVLTADGSTITQTIKAHAEFIVREHNNVAEILKNLVLAPGSHFWEHMDAAQVAALLAGVVTEVELVGSDIE